MGIEPKYKFDWSLIGDLDVGRPNLGRTTRVEMYRLMQFTFRAALEAEFGTEAADRVFYQAGLISGKEFYDRVMPKTNQFDVLIRQLTESLKQFGVGILRIEKADLESGQFVFTMAEDLDCSGLPEMDYEICVYDEGFFAGILESFTGKPFHVKEIDCWCTGGRICRFSAESNAG